MQKRTCVSCGFDFRLKNYLRTVFFGSVFSEWSCKNCGAELNENSGRRLLLSFLAIGPVAILPYFADVLVQAGVPQLLSWIVGLCSLAGWAILIFTINFYLRKGDNRGF